MKTERSGNGDEYSIQLKEMKVLNS